MRLLLWAWEGSGVHPLPGDVWNLPLQELCHSSPPRVIVSAEGLAAALVPAALAWEGWCRVLCYGVAVNMDTVGSAVPQLTSSWVPERS